MPDETVAVLVKIDVSSKVDLCDLTPSKTQLAS